MVPPIAFLPNSVPCGPRKISTRSRSSRSRIAPRPAVIDVVDVDRHAGLERKRVVAETDAANEGGRRRAPSGPSGWMIVFGENVSIIVTSVRLRASMFSPENAVMASGVSCRFSSRKRADTTISSSPLSWAMTGAPATKAPAASPAPVQNRPTRVVREMVDMIFPLLCVSVSADARLVTDGPFAATTCQLFFVIVYYKPVEIHTLPRAGISHSRGARASGNARKV